MTRLLAVTLYISVLATAAQAIPTDITVRVLSKDAKFIGTSMDGAGVVIKDAFSGEILARGKTEGSTGDTDRLVKNPRVRGQTLSDRKSAVFSVTLNLHQTTKLLVEAEGPLSNPDSANRVTATYWVVPGKHLTGGDGVLLEIPGFSVNASASVAGGKEEILTVSANVTMMCGCPIEPGGLWDANGYEVAAMVTDSAGNTHTIPMKFAGKTSHFSGKAKLEGEGPFEALVYAYDSSNGNTGVDIVRFNTPLKNGVQEL